MNLIEIILALRGKNPVERAKMLRDMGVSSDIWGDIERCFDEDGNIIGATGKQVKGVVDLNREQTDLPVLYDLTQNPNGSTTGSFRVVFEDWDEEKHPPVRVQQYQLEIKITHEGLILDLWNEDKNVWTSARTFRDILEAHGGM